MEFSKMSKSSRGRECAAAYCTSTFYNKDGKASGISFFKFPAKNPERTRWCSLVKRQHGRDGFSVTSHTVVCEKHFQDKDILKTPGGTRKRLREGNVCFLLGPNF
jgi:hypothetical protein